MTTNILYTYYDDRIRSLPVIKNKFTNGKILLQTNIHKPSKLYTRRLLSNIHKPSKLYTRRLLSNINYSLPLLNTQFLPLLNPPSKRTQSLRFLPKLII